MDKANKRAVAVTGMVWYCHARVLFVITLTLKSNCYSWNHTDLLQCLWICAAHVMSSASHFGQEVLVCLTVDEYHNNMDLENGCW